MRHTHCRTQNMARNNEKRENMRNVHGRTWNIARKLTNKENKKITWQDLEYGEKDWKIRKLKNVQCRTWITARKLKKNAKLVTHTVGPGIGQETLKNVKNDKCTLQDL